MKTLSTVIVLGILSAPGLVCGAEEKIDVETLKQELRELRQRTEQLERKLQLLESPPPRGAAGLPPVATTTGAAGQAPPAALPASTPSDGSESLLTKRWSPTAPITVMRSGDAYMNIGFDALIDVGGSTAREPSDYLQLGGHDPRQRGFTAPNSEIVLSGAVDPYFTAMANFVFQLDKDNETSLELEEVYAKTTALPWNLQLKVGQYFANFGRQNPQHPHQWDFVDQPLILNRIFGPDGLRSIGTDISWLAPTPFFAEFTLGILNGNGEQGFLFRNGGEPDANDIRRFRGRATVDRPLAGPQDLLLVPRFATSFELTDQQTLLLGASGAFGPNATGPDARTEVYGVDLFWKWKSAAAEKGFPFVAFQTEGLFSRYEAAADPGVYDAETLYDYGFYSQILWGFRPRWVAGLRGDWVDGNAGADDPNDPFRGQRTRVSPNLTWYFTEFSKLRLQYNYDKGELFGTEHSVWMQLEFQLGAHTPHKF